MVLSGRSGSLRFSANKLESNIKENVMTRISTFCVVSSALTVLALSANGASAGSPTVTTVRPPMNFHAPSQQPRGTSRYVHINKITKDQDSTSQNGWVAVCKGCVHPNIHQSNQLGVRYNPPKY